MNKQNTTVIGVVLILLGLVGLMFSVVLPALGLNVWGWIWRLWPLLVQVVGLLLILPPLLVRDRRGLGALFIPGLPILTTGGILFLANVLDQWNVWAYLWPLEVLAVGLGFLFAALYMRVIWLVIPAIIIGCNGVILQFCALTGLWDLWAVLWTVEPLAVGLSLLVVATKTGSAGLSRAGRILMAVAGVGLVGMLLIFSRGWVFNLIGPAVLILIGLVLLVRGWQHRTSAPGSVSE